MATQDAEDNIDTYVHSFTPLESQPAFLALLGLPDIVHLLNSTPALSPCGERCARRERDSSMPNLKRPFILLVNVRRYRAMHAPRDRPFGVRLACPVFTL